MTRTPYMPRGPVLTVAAAALLLLSSFTCFLSPAAAFVDRGEVLSRTLPSGMEVLVREEPAQKVVELQVWVGVGSRDEPAGREGIAHLFEHMLFKGTVKRGVGEIARTVEASGGDINAYTSMDHTVYHITIAREFFQTAVDILADAVLNSTFDAEELEKEKLVVIEEIHRGRDNPSRVFNEELFKAAFTVHPYGRTVIGTPESVSSVTRQDMVDFHRAWYVPGNMKLVAVGGVGADQVFEAAGRLFDVPAAEGAVRTRVREPEQGSMRSFTVVLDSEPARLALAFPIGSLTDPETPVLDLAAAILGSGGSSRLTARLRDSGLVHSAWSYAYTPVDPGIFVLGATTAQERVPQALEGLLREVARLQSEPVSEQELDRARDQILSDKIFSKETVEGQAREIGYVALTLGDLDFNDKYYSRLQSVEPSDILEAARRVFRPERATVGFLVKGPEFTPDEEKVNALLEGTLMSGRKAEKGEGEAVYRSVLPNGVTLLVREDHRLPIVAARVGFLGGSRYETADSQGIFNLLAHLLTRGTRKRTALEMAETLDGMSASLGGFSGRNSFGVTGVFLSKDASEGFSLMREVLTESTFPEEEVALFRERIISAIRAQRDNMTSFALDLFRQTLFKEHPYRFPVMGTEESVASLSREELLSRYGSIVKPQAMVVSVAGDITVERAYDLLRANFGDMEGEPYDPGPLPVEVPDNGPSSARVRRDDKAQSHIILGYPGPTLDAEDLDALEVLNAVLAGQGGRLFRELRDRQGLAYSVFSFVAPGLDPGYIAFGIGVSPEREGEALEGFRDQIRRVREEAVPDDELQRAREYMVGSHMIGLQTLQSRADEVFFPALYGQGLDRALAFRKRIQSVTADQVRAAARRYLDPDRYTLAVVEGGDRQGEE